MKFTLATIIACAATLALAHEYEYREIMKKDIVCPTAGGTATVSHPCYTGAPSSISKHPHSKPTSAMEHTKSKKWDGTVTVYPSGAPELTVTPGIDCQGETGPSCAFITFAMPTCTMHPRGTGQYRKAEKTHSSLPTITASAGATKTVRAKRTATCKSTSVSIN